MSQTEQASSETDEALAMFNRASAATSHVPVAHGSAPDGGEGVDGSADEATGTASSFNARRRENAALRKLDAKNTSRKHFRPNKPNPGARGHADAGAFLYCAHTPESYNNCR